MCVCVYIYIYICNYNNSAVSFDLRCNMSKYICVDIPYSGYNLRGAIFANHQISHLAVIFAIIKFANHCMYRVTFCVAKSIYAPVAYRYFDYKRRL